MRGQLSRKSRLKNNSCRSFLEKFSRTEFDRCHLETSYLEQKTNILYVTDKLKRYSQKNLDLLH
ncbi:hypothetical protein CFPU101_16370 [Chroococcus sp. FPU101]|nr:hypothetical protein CFPU101_16370 [Chroococcus sp. FPU101]